MTTFLVAEKADLETQSKYHYDELAIVFLFMRLVQLMCSLLHYRSAKTAVLEYVSTAFLLIVNIGCQAAVAVMTARPGVINKQNVDIFQVSLDVFLLELVVWDCFVQAIILSVSGFKYPKVRDRFKALSAR